MNYHLIFRLYGALASWGQPAVGIIRPTAIHPSRSALLGLLGAALGIARADAKQQQALQHSVRFAIKQLMPTTLLRDYHTTQTPKVSGVKTHSHTDTSNIASSCKKNIVTCLTYRTTYLIPTRKVELDNTSSEAIISSRDYRCDGLWIIAVSLNPSSQYQLEELQDALLNPKYHLYLGRKSCPLSSPLHPKIVQTLTLKQALDVDFPPLTQSTKQDAFLLGKGKSVSYFWEGDANSLGTPAENSMLHSLWDEPMNRKRWQFQPRQHYSWSQMEESCIYRK